ncbi:MAG: hypothetical protein QM501_04745 [Gimesia sp.]
MLKRSRIAALLLTGLGVLLCLSFCYVQEIPAQPSDQKTNDVGRSLSDRQEAISQQFKRFETTLHDLGEYMKKTDPARADLLFRAFGQSKQNQTTVEMQRILQMLQKGQLGEAVERQDDLVKNMQNLLALLQSEDRMSEVEKEKQRIQDLLKDVNRLIGQERDVRAATERGENPGDLKEKQKQTSDNAQKLIEKIKEQDSENNDSPKSEDQKQGKQENKKTDGKKQDKNSKKKDSESKSKDSKSKGKDPEAGKSDPNQKGTPEQKQSQQQQSESQQQKKQNSQEASNQQLERELMLAAMEARLQKILAQQKRVYAGTLSIGQVPEKERTSRHTARAVQLAREESSIGLEVEKTLLLLRDEGSSVAFTEALSVVREDVQTTSYRLNRTQVGKLTQEIEKDIISALEEMIDALQNEMEKSEKEKQKNQQQQQQQQPSQDGQSLIDKLAEIKMLRSLQLRVNNRTRRIEKLALEKDVNQADIIEQLQQLSNRQTRIQNATYILATGKNK